MPAFFLPVKYFHQNHKDMKNFVLSVLFCLFSLVAWGQKQEVTKIYTATSRYNADFTFDGKLMYSGINITTSKNNFFWQDKKVYDGRNTGCTVKYHINGDYLYKGKASFDDDILYKIDGSKAYLKKTDVLAFTYDGQVLYEKDSNNVLLRADKKNTVPFAMMIAAWLSLQY